VAVRRPRSGGERASREAAPGDTARRERYLACLAELSTRLLQAPDPRAVLDVAVRWLRDASDADRCYVFENRAGADGVLRTTLRVEACAPGIEPMLGHPGASDAPLVVFDRPELARGEPLFGPVDAFPREARGVLEPQGIRAVALLPIQLEGSWWGTLGFDACRPGLRFEQADVALLRTAANAIGAALERSRKEEALRRSEKRFRAIVDQAFDLIGEADAQGNYLYASPSHEAVLGVPPAELIGTNAFERVHPEDRAGALNTFQAAEPRGGGGFAVFRVRHADGGWRWIECTGRFFDAGDGERRAVIMGRDVSERRRDETERLRLGQAMDQAGDAIVMWGLDGRITYVNAAWERLTGKSRSEALGGRVLHVTKPIPGSRPMEEIIPQIVSGRPWSGRLPKYGGGFLDATINPVRDADGRVVQFVSVMRDVSREVELENQIRRQQKLEAIGTLATGVAHDFNNLLTGVLGYAELLSQRRPSAEEVSEAAHVIGEAARRGAELTSQLLGFGLQSRLRSEPVDVHETIGEVVRLLSRTFPRSVAIRSELRAERSNVLGDPGQLQQVFLNLAVNARDAMPEGGELSFESELVAGNEGPALAVRVTDTGTGIPVDLRERIFEPFFTTKQSEKGTGMGLAVVYGIVQSHRGAIELASEVGSGTRFEIRLPLSEAAPPARAAATAGDPVKGEGRVLVVDDEPAVRRVAARMLRRLGYETDEAEDGAAAVARVRAAPGAYALVLLDLDMPGMNGRACLRALRAIEPELPVVLSTGLPASELGESLAGSVAGLLPKPYEMLRLSETVAAAIRGEE
jgi:PAS domain S-box-containing protein